MINNKLPNWLTKSVKDGNGNKTKISLFSHHPLDHFEGRKNDKGEIEYVSQPYGLSYHWLKSMISICEDHGIEFDITGDTDHLPGRTVMVKWRKQKK